jgi:L-2-hydroxyglutarate oxidase LhgO
MTQPRVIIIGAGIIGLATGLELKLRHPHVNLIILEKELEVAKHQTGHNSGVIHSGIYYKPGSLKARLCVRGAHAMRRFCQEHEIPFNICGKVIIATKQSELLQVEELYRRGIANGIPDLRIISREEIREREPHALGICGILVPETAITDFSIVAQKYAYLIRQLGGTIQFGACVIGISQTTNQITIKTTKGDFSGTYAVNCAGLYSDKIARMSANCDGVRIVPFRGEYYKIIPQKQHLVQGLIYPVPDPRFPFLGVHFTRMIHGGVEAGPNAVLAFRREGYRKIDISLSEMAGTLLFSGFWKMALKNWKSAVGEYYRSYSKHAFVSELQRLVPELTGNDLVAGGAGVRAQALERDGNLIDDFRFEDRERIMHIYNVPSPAATASLVIAAELVSRIAERIGGLVVDCSTRSIASGMIQ